MPDRDKYPDGHKRPDECVWKRRADNLGAFYLTDCGLMSSPPNCTPKENDYICPKCGGKIVEKKAG